MRSPRQWGPTSKGDGREERGDGKGGEGNSPKVKASRINVYSVSQKV